MSQKIYSLLQGIIPELKAQSLPIETDFYTFSEWINEQHIFFHYFELTEYYDNGIEDNFYLKKHHVDTEKLQAEIEREVNNLFQESDDVFDVSEETEEIIFDKIKISANLFQLSLLVVYRENPYWILVPTQEETQLNQIVEAFNDAFNNDGDLTMAEY